MLNKLETSIHTVPFTIQIHTVKVTTIISLCTFVRYGNSAVTMNFEFIPVIKNWLLSFLLRVFSFKNYYFLPTYVDFFKVLFIQLLCFQRNYGVKGAAVYRVSVKVGEREFQGEGPTAQAARHDAASRALEELRNLPVDANNRVCKGYTVEGLFLFCFNYYFY